MTHIHVTELAYFFKFKVKLKVPNLDPSPSLAFKRQLLAFILYVSFCSMFLYIPYVLGNIQMQCKYMKYFCVFKVSFDIYIL